MQSTNLFQDLFNNAQNNTNGKITDILTDSVNKMLAVKKSKYRNKMLTLLAEKSIKSC
jgi:hypothetical protein